MYLYGGVLYWYYSHALCEINRFQSRYIVCFPLGNVLCLYCDMINKNQVQSQKSSPRSYLLADQIQELTYYWNRFSEIGMEKKEILFNLYALYEFSLCLSISFCATWIWWQWISLDNLD